jgi:hypothetical protein
MTLNLKWWKLIFSAWIFIWLIFIICTKNYENLIKIRWKSARFLFEFKSHKNMRLRLDVPDLTPHFETTCTIDGKSLKEHKTKVQPLSQLLKQNPLLVENFVISYCLIFIIMKYNFKCNCFWWFSIFQN